MSASVVNADVILPDLSYRILEVAFEVHNQLGPGFPEEIYEKAFVCELEARGIPCERQKVINVFYKGSDIGVFRLDLVVDGKIIVELKAVTQMNEVFKAQLISYLRATGMKLGLLINFGSRRVEYHRLANSLGRPKEGKRNPLNDR